MTLSKVQRSGWLLSGLCVIAGCGGGESGQPAAVTPAATTTATENPSSTAPQPVPAAPVSADA
ncbi:MAG: hypothetical protein ACK5DM_12560, partial [Planctomyces sp.]